MRLPPQERELAAASRSWHRTPEQPRGGLCCEFRFLALSGEPQRQKAAGEDQRDRDRGPDPINHRLGTWGHDQPLLGLSFLIQKMG